MIRAGIERGVPTRNPDILLFISVLNEGVVLFATTTLLSFRRLTRAIYVIYRALTDSSTFS